MADEEKQVESKPQEEKPVAESVTDADLSSAYDSDQQTQTEVKEEPKEVAEQVKEEVVEEKAEEHQEDLPEEPADNAERSRLGRSVKETKDKITSVEQKLNDVLARLDARQPQQPQAAQPQVSQTYDNSFINAQVEAAVERGELPATIVTPQDSIVVSGFIEKVKTEMERQYAIGYINNLKSPQLRGSTPDDIHAEVIAELQRVDSPFNRKQYFNPHMDSKMNYLEAKNAILEKRLSTEKSDKTVFKGKPKDAPPTGTSVTTKMATPVNDLPPLDEASLDFIKREGMSPESVAAALKGSMPLHLGGRR